MLRKPVRELTELEYGLPVILAPEARHRRCVQLLGRGLARAFRSGLRRDGRRRGRLALGVVDREAQLAQRRGELTDLLLELIQLLTHGLRLDEHEGLLSVDRLDLFGQSGALARRRVLILLDLGKLSVQIRDLRGAARSLGVSTRARGRHHHDDEQRERRDRGRTAPRARELHVVDRSIAPEAKSTAEALLADQFHLWYWASCERDEARAPWRPEAYVKLGEPQARQADPDTRRAGTSHVEGCHGARNEVWRSTLLQYRWFAPRTTSASMRAWTR